MKEDVLLVTAIYTKYRFWESSVYSPPCSYIRKRKLWGQSPRHSINICGIYQNCW